MNAVAPSKRDWVLGELERSQSPKKKPLHNVETFERVCIIKWLCFFGFYQEEVNPLTGIKELLSNEDMITLVLIDKAKKGDVNAYKALLDSA